MPSREIKQRYSCRRKPDVITAAAIGMFILLAVFQLYITLVVPALLKKNSSREYHVGKEEMIRQMDTLRGAVRSAPARNKLQRGETTLVLGVLDNLAKYTSANQDDLDMKDVFTLKHILSQYESIYRRWLERPPRFSLQEEKIDVGDLLLSIENEIKSRNELP